MPYRQIANVKLVIRTVCGTESLRKEKDALAEEMEVLVGMIQKAVAENSQITQNQTEYQKRYNGLVEKYEEAKGKYNEVESAISAKETQRIRLEYFIRELQKLTSIVQGFDARMRGSLVDFVTVSRNKEITDSGTEQK